jgi:outer membrane protein
MTDTMRISRGALAALTLLLVAAPAAAQTTTAADTLELALDEAVGIALRENPQIARAAVLRSAAGAGVWSAYGNLLPRLDLQGQIQRSDEGSFVIFGAEFTSPATYSTQYQWSFTHTLLDSGRDWFRIKGARATVDREIATYDDQAWQTASDVKVQYLTARRGEALVAQARRELERRQQHLRLAEARYEVGAVTKSDALQARLTVNQGEVAALQAEQGAEEAKLALRRLLGGALPPGPIELTSSFDVFPPPYDPDSLVAQAIVRHPALRRLQAQEQVDDSNLWVARSRYLPSLQAQYGISRSVVDTQSFQFGDFDDRDFFLVSLNWQLFGGFSRYDETSRANAALRATREDARAQELLVEEAVRTAFTRLMTAYATHQSALLSVEIAQEDLRLGEGRYRTGAGSFVDLLDARVRAAQAETDLITAVYDFHLALVALERASGVPLMPLEDMP